MQIEKPVTPLDSNFNWIWHYSFQERIIEMKNEINIPWMNSLVREQSKRMNGFDCNTKSNVVQSTLKNNSQSSCIVEAQWSGG